MLETVFLARRGRGIGNLIEGLGEGDPWAWGILIVVLAVFLGPPIYRALNKPAAEPEPEPEGDDHRDGYTRDAPGEGDGED